jgi:predicted phosphodiesterase
VSDIDVRQGEGEADTGRVAVLYDIHGNLTALEAVLAEAEAAGAESYLLGGDYAAFGPWPRETLERLDELPVKAWIRGNGERWLVEPPEGPPEAHDFLQAALSAVRGELTAEQVSRLYALPTQAELGGVLFCHGSPLSDIDSFAPDSEENDERLLAGVSGSTVVFGHSHVQFRRPGPAETDLVNPGSVGCRWTVIRARRGPSSKRVAASSSAAPTTTSPAPWQRCGRTATGRTGSSTVSRPAATKRPFRNECKRFDRSVQTDARAKPAPPDGRRRKRAP